MMDGPRRESRSHLITLATGDKLSSSTLTSTVAEDPLTLFAPISINVMHFGVKFVIYDEKSV